MSFSCRCKFSEYFVSELIPKKLFKCAFAKWLRSITSTEETGDSVDFCADQFETSTNPPAPPSGANPGHWTVTCAREVGNLTIAWVEWEI